MKTFPDKLSGHCAIVTGATGGIGSCFCREFAARGCSLILTDLSAASLLSAADSIKSDFPDIDIATLPLDLCRDDAADVIDEFCTANGLDPDILVNNAGIFSFSTIAATSEAKTETFINLHVRAVTMLSRWFAIRRAKARSGWILNMSSLSCWMPMPGIALYAATKAYIRVFTRALHYEMKDSGVRVMAACPGGIATDLFGLPKNLQRLAVRLGVLATPEKFTRKAVSRLMRGKKQYINGFLNRLMVPAVYLTSTSMRVWIKHRMLDKT